MVFSVKKQTLPEPTGPMTQIKSPGCASNTIFLNENVAFYKSFVAILFN
jgi:hypothetical protein